MYKVFINEHLIRLQSEELNFDNEKAHLILSDPSKTEIQELVGRLFNEANKSEVVINSKDLDGLWSDFRGSFKLIEAAGGVVRNQKGEKLLIKRLGKWDLPKGKMEKGESPEESALREVEEECDLSSLELKDSLEPTYHMYQLGDKDILKKTYWFNIVAKGNISVKPQTEEGITEVRWFAEKDLTDARKNTYRSLMELI